jgi:psiF repeat
MRRAHAAAFIASAAAFSASSSDGTKENTTMKQLIAACALALPFLAGQAFAQGSAPAAAPTAPAARNSQQDKMKQCNMDAAGKKGDERKAFMKGCLSDKPAAAAKPMTQQEKMAACSKANKGKKGDEYKNAQKECLSKG